MNISKLSSNQSFISPTRSELQKGFKISQLTQNSRRHSLTDIKGNINNLNQQSPSQNLTFYLFVQKFESLFDKLNGRVAKLEELHSQIMKKLQLNEQIQELREKELQNTLTKCREQNDSSSGKEWDKVVQVVERQRLKTREIEERVAEIAAELPEILKVSKQEILKVKEEVDAGKQESERIKAKNSRLEEDVFEVLNLSKDVNMQINEFMKPLWDEITKLRAGLAFVIQIQKSINNVDSEEVIDPFELV